MWVPGAFVWQRPQFCPCGVGEPGELPWSRPWISSPVLDPPCQNCENTEESCQKQPDVALYSFSCRSGVLIFWLPLLSIWSPDEKWQHLLVVFKGGRGLIADWRHTCVIKSLVKDYSVATSPESESEKIRECCQFLSLWCTCLQPNFAYSWSFENKKKSLVLKYWNCIVSWSQGQWEFWELTGLRRLVFSGVFYETRPA